MCVLFADSFIKSLKYLNSPHVWKISSICHICLRSSAWIKLWKLSGKVKLSEKICLSKKEKVILILQIYSVWLVQLIIAWNNFTVMSCLLNKGGKEQQCRPSYLTLWNWSYRNQAFKAETIRGKEVVIWGHQSLWRVKVSTQSSWPSWIIIVGRLGKMKSMF